MDGFLHIEMYGRKANTRLRSRTSTITAAIAEALRRPGSCSHVAEPMPPTLLFGKSLDDLECEAIALSFVAKDRLGRKWRSDGAVLLTGIVSYPVPVKDLTTEEATALYQGWLLSQYPSFF